MSPLVVYDTLTRREREFEPLKPGEVGMYVCGLTVQDKPHIGHFLPVLTADVIRRYLEYKGYAVTHVQNFTDVDDKIIERARQEGVAPEVIAERNIVKTHEALAAMNVLEATHYPRATEHIPEIIEMIETLIAKDFAYAAANGDVYYRVRKFATYGKLSGRKIDDLMSGARIEVGEEKDDPLDFALWKAAKPGEPQWESPWGGGRPGWHIECSAMSMKYLGETLDMHGGGRDLIFPHHENELAQSEAATGKPFVNYWMHNGLLNTNGQKMSKSLGNFWAVEDLLTDYTPDELRFFLLSTHFRSQAEYSSERLDEARTAFGRLREGVARLGEAARGSGNGGALISADGQDLRELAAKLQSEFYEAMDHDFNAAAALGKAFELVRASNRFLDALATTEGDAGRDGAVVIELRRRLVEMLRLLGFFQVGAPESTATDNEVPAEVEQLARERVAAREARNWGRADEIRDRILDLGYVLEDRPGGYRVKPK